MAKVFILMGSQSDMEIMKKAADVLNDFGIESEIHVASAHRTPKRVHALTQRINKEADVVIAGAGMAAHLPGVLAAVCIPPVIGVPINASLDGMDALLAIAQMPPGIPVATVAINGSKNAGFLAAQIIALYDESIRNKFLAYRDSLED